MPRTNSYSCMLDAFAEVMGVEVRTLIAEIGHDGLNRDGTARGFHSQELIDRAVQRGFSVTEIIYEPWAWNERTQTEYPIAFPGGNDARFVWHLSHGDGVLTGLNRRGRHHAIVWRGGQAIDTDGRLIDLLTEDGRLLTGDFEPATFLRISHD